MPSSRVNTINSAAFGFIAALALAQRASAAATIKNLSPLTVCQPVGIEWSEAPDGDVFLSVIPPISSSGGGEVGEALMDLGKQSGQSGNVVWTVNLAADTEVTFKLVDSSGQAAYTEPIKISAGTDTNCIGKPAVVTAGPGSSSGTVASGSVSSTSGSSSSSSSGVSSSTGVSDGSTTKATSVTSGTIFPGAANATGSAVSGFSSLTNTTSIATPGSGFLSFQMSGFALGLAGVAAVVATFA